MADEAFALSPISARAALPSEEDYAAISEAFMETSRGRWFLTEYAKRNRNADTRMVLDAVARIEQSLAAQKDESLAAQREAAAAAAAADTSLYEAKLAEARLAEAKFTEARLAEAMAAIRNAIEAARASAVEALDGFAMNERLAPVRKGARVLREIAWRLREIGNDGRICDLIDSQVGVIEKGAEQLTSDEAKNEVRAALGAAFAAIEGPLANFSGEATPAPVAETVQPQPVHEVPQASTAAISTDAVAPVAEASVAAADARPEEMESAQAVDLSPEAADAHDEAVLDMIAMEMGAPDPFDDDEIVEPAATSFAEPPVAPAIAAELSEPMAAPVGPPVQVAPQPVVQTETRSEPAREISLGSSIIASGIVRRPVVAANDPLAPIRRMSQAEKIAFFS